MEKWDIEKLKNEDIKTQYEIKLEQKLIARMASEHHDINDAWNQIRQNVESAATKTIGKRTKSRRNHWFDNECQEAFNEKNAARQKNLSRQTRAGTEDYRSKRFYERKLFRRKKRQQ